LPIPNQPVRGGTALGETAVSNFGSYSTPPPNPWLKGLMAALPAVVSTMESAGIANRSLPTLSGLENVALQVATGIFFEAAAQTLALTPQETAQFLRGLMRLPDEPRLVVANLLMEHPKLAEELSQLKQEAPQEVAQALLAAVVQANPEMEIPLPLVQKFMKEHLAEGQKDILKLVQSQRGAQAAETAKQLGEMVGTLSKLAAQTNTSPTMALQTLGLIVLPWLPLPPPMKFEMDFQPGEGGDGEESGGTEMPLVLWLETLSFGKMKVAVSLATPVQAAIAIEHDPQAAVLKGRLEERLTQSLKGDGLQPPKVDWQQRALVKKYERVEAASVEASAELQASSARNSQSDDKGRRMTVVPPQGVSMVVVQVALLTGKTIFELDDKAALLYQRTKQLPEPEAE
jgi:hypothetical protein